MSWLIVGTVPRADFGLYWGAAQLDGTELLLGGARVRVARGTPALVAAALVAATFLHLPAPEVLLAGDIGTGEGSRQVYAALASEVHRVQGPGVTFHYLMPDVAGHNQVLWALESLRPRPLLVADAGFMYAAKMSGFAAHYDLFTPDAGEMAFLADESAPHPFYTRGFLLQDEEAVPDLVRRAYAGENAARALLVKGRTDAVVEGGRIVARIAAPDVPAMEPIGGTGDTLTALVSMLLAARLSIQDACCVAALANRFLGELAQPTPAFGVAEFLPFVPAALTRAWEARRLGPLP
jgi:hypothetical protein